MSDLTEFAIGAASEHLARGEVSSSGLAEAYLARIAALEAERDALRAALEGTVYVFADHAEATRALTRAELEQLAFARAVLARCKGE